MGLFDKFKKQQPEQEETASLVNDPQPFVLRLFYARPPAIDFQQILEKLRKEYRLTEMSGDGQSTIFVFRDLDSGVEMDNGVRMSPVCAIQSIADGAMDLPPQAYQQNWEWKEAAAVTAECKYAVLVNDMMTGILDYRLRHKLFMSFLSAVIEVTAPLSMYSYSAEKLVDPVKIVGVWAQQANFVLEAIMNVRLFNITGTVENDIVMDTIGLNRLGLPDLQVRFTRYDANAIGLLLWNYAYYIAENGDIIVDGSTIEGPGGEVWHCLHVPSLVGPERIALTMITE